MLKNKMFLQGLGLGIILGAVLLQMIFFVDPKQNEIRANSILSNQEHSEMYRQQFLEYAERNGYTVAAPGEKLYTESDLEASIKQAEEQWQKNHGEPSGHKPLKKGIYIQRGLSSLEVAERLYEFGIIDHPEQFIDLMAQQNLQRKVQFGYYEFEGNVDVQDVIEMITLDAR